MLRAIFGKEFFKLSRTLPDITNTVWLKIIMWLIWACIINSSVGELPAHNHTASTSTTGNHTHNVTIFEYFEGGNGWGLGTYKNGKYWQGARFQDGCNVQKNTTNWVQQTGNHSPTVKILITSIKLILKVNISLIFIKKANLIILALWEFTRF